jgi:hypothetical protein
MGAGRRRAICGWPFFSKKTRGTGHWLSAVLETNRIMNRGYLNRFLLPMHPILNSTHQQPYFAEVMNTIDPTRHSGLLLALLSRLH